MVRLKAIPRKIYGLITGKPMNFSLIDKWVGGSARPMSEREVRWLRKKGVGAILSLTEEPLDPSWVEGVAYKNIPIRDHAVPTIAELRESVDFINSQCKMNRLVVVHCMAGKGRTGSVLAAYMCQKYGLPPMEAIAKLRSKRPGSVERKQVQVVEEFSKSLPRTEPQPGN